MSPFSLLSTYYSTTKSYILLTNFSRLILLQKVLILNYYESSFEISIFLILFINFDFWPFCLFVTCYSAFTQAASSGSRILIELESKF